MFLSCETVHIYQSSPPEEVAAALAAANGGSGAEMLVLCASLPRLQLDEDSQIGDLGLQGIVLSLSPEFLVLKVPGCVLL